MTELRSRSAALPSSSPHGPHGRRGRPRQAAGFDRLGALETHLAAGYIFSGCRDLRHAAVSIWLANLIPPAQVAEWAGHSLAVLLRVYAKVLAGGADAAADKLDRGYGI